VAHEPQEKNSVFDFLYVDHHRIGLYLSQFSDFGNLTNLVHSQRAGDETSVSGGIPSIAKGEAKESQQTGIERHFDTQWSQVLNFLDELQTRGMVRRSLDGAPIGCILLVPGNLFLVNMRSFEKTWGAISSGVTKQEPHGIRNARRAVQSRDRIRSPGADMEGLRILGSLEQPIFMVLRSGEHRLWSTLAPDYLIGGSADLNLKHGLRVSGEWYVLGILDCLPGAGKVESSEMGRLSGGGDNSFSDSMVGMWNEFRLVFGRPVDCYGVTPIVIMREIG
jgi:hypothetical protein